MANERFEADIFHGKEGTTYDVYADDAFQFKMELIEVRLEKERKLPKWNSVFQIRKQPFSLMFESDGKIRLRKNMIVNGGVFDFFPLKIEAIDETPKGYIYQACFE